MSQPTVPSERLLYRWSGLTKPNLSMESPLRGPTVNEQYINDKILANNKNNNNINNIKDIRNYYETETNNYNQKLSRYKNFINIAKIREILLSSIGTTATST